MMRNRLRDIIENKIAMGGEGCDCGYGGVIVGGRRRKRRSSSRKGTFGRKVGAYMRRHGVSLAEAAHALRGSGEGSYAGARRRRVGRPRKRYGSKSSRRRRGGITAYEKAKKSRQIAKMQRELEEDDTLYNELCNEDTRKNLRSLADIKEYNKTCKLTPAEKKRLYKREALDELIADYVLGKKKKQKLE